MEYDYRAEYSKSGRASCRGCKSTIAKDVLRLAALVQSPMFDGKMAQWYHMMCFFSKQRPKTIDEIEHFETLRYDDQKKIKDKIEELSASAVVPSGKKGKKRDAAQSSALKDYTLEYAKSSRAFCRGCEQKIMKDEVRISKKDFTTDIGKKYGGQDMWHHLSCFAKLRSELGYFEGGDKLPGYNSLKAADKDEVKKELPAIKQEGPPVKKMKSEDAVDAKEDKEFEKKLKKQTDTMFKHRDNLKKIFKKRDLYSLLEYNNQAVPEGEEEALDRLADVMTFGALKRCPECKNGQFVFTKAGYQCQGNVTEWSKCINIVKEPERKEFKISNELRQEFESLRDYKSKIGVRLFREVAPKPSIPVALKKEETEEEHKPKIEREKPALYDMEFVILGKTASSKDSLKKKITKLGGKVVTKIGDNIMAIISTLEEVERMNSRMAEAKEADIHVVSEDFLKEVPKYLGKIPQLIIKKSISDWGSDPEKRMPPENSKSMMHKSGSMYTKSVPSKKTVTVKGGIAIDPDSGLDKEAHVYQSRDDKYTVVLGLTDIQSKKNSYYKMQILEADKGGKYWVFRSWGRIGTTIGGNKLDKFTSLHEAKTMFKDLYEERTGNLWENRHNFVKVPGRMYPIELSYGDDDSNLNINEDIPSKLDKPIQNLVKMIFDINSMKNTMKGYEIDMEKMPLGKLSKNQIQSAFKILSELQELVNKDSKLHDFVDPSNRFYTFIPHSFGVEDPPVINTADMIKQKLEMLDFLLETEIAYSVMKSCGNNSGVDEHYKTLNTDLEVLNKESEEFKIIEEYVKNTHAATHSLYELEIAEVFAVKRHGEDRLYKPFKKMPNRKLLWHGSRLTNYVGILKQGLRIAPPEAPVTGYMFGKGIYFADMVSKSANYCNTSPQNPTGLMLLCEVALGQMYERKKADYIEKLPKGKHSCKGMGKTEPDPSGSKQLNGIEVPCGKPRTVEGLKSDLLYNEYIVYDTTQVNTKYLLQMNFKYKY